MNRMWAMVDGSVAAFAAVDILEISAAPMPLLNLAGVALAVIYAMSRYVTKRRTRPGN